MCVRVSVSGCVGVCVPVKVNLMNESYSHVGDTNEGTENTAVSFKVSEILLLNI